ncbi:MAG: threonylcarbamoyladenosine tRNA methylthiotransferase MtaB [Gammaproteobacteria bacterium]|jgi:threonylcarbamoyladenosine tRNA methylthiotransferase MtaB
MICTVVMKNVAFTTFGCRLNQYDTETVRTLIEGTGGWRTVSNQADAHVVVVNTCSVTARADATARKAIRRIHKEHPHARIVVTGCYAQRAPQDLAQLAGVSLVVGAADRAQVAVKLDTLRADQVEVAVSPIEQATTFLDVPITEMMEHSRAYVKVQEGCDEKCSFCIVPQTRGRSRSRSSDSVLSQARTLVDAGYLELVLTGVHIGDYGLDLDGGKRRLASLLRELLRIPGLTRLRLSSIEPASITPEIIELMASEERFARHFHIPFQSASDGVLQRMRRRYRAQELYDLLHTIADRIPECGIGCDVICGFPGETDEDFQLTFDALTSLPVHYVHPFAYSVRPGSEAEAFGDQISPDIKKRRVQALKRLMRDKNREFREQHVGRLMPVLLEPSRHAGQSRLGGWTDNYLRVDMGVGAADIAIRQVRITGLSEHGLQGRIESVATV